MLINAFALKLAVGAGTRASCERRRIVPAHHVTDLSPSTGMEGAAQADPDGNVGKQMLPGR
ncbi:MAG TPA: hypothetical protein VHG93_25900 [Longimicrobium sp.]|nr:hypothetical protein [Longimicrobium sp.]